MTNRENCQRIRDILGEKYAEKFFTAYRGEHFSMPVRASKGHRIAELVGIKRMRALCAALARKGIRIPKGAHRETCAVATILRSVLGEQAVSEFIAQHAGVRIYIPKNPRESSFLFKHIGMDALQALSCRYGGRSVDIPASKKQTYASTIRRMILDGCSIKSITHTVPVSITYVYKVLQDMRISGSISTAKKFDLHIRNIRNRMEIVSLLGIEKAQLLSDAFPKNRELYIPIEATEGHRIAKVIGVDSLKILCDRFRQSKNKGIRLLPSVKNKNIISDKKIAKIVKIIGHDTLKKLYCYIGVRDFRIPKIALKNHRIEKAVGIDEMKKICKYFGGKRIYIPKCIG